MPVGVEVLLDRLAGCVDEAQAFLLRDLADDGEGNVERFLNRVEIARRNARAELVVVAAAGLQGEALLDRRERAEVFRERQLIDAHFGADLARIEDVLEIAGESVGKIDHRVRLAAQREAGGVARLRTMETAVTSSPARVRAHVSA